MHQIKRIIELYREGRSSWATTRLTGLSRTTIRDYLQRLNTRVELVLKSCCRCMSTPYSLTSILYVDGFDRGQSGHKPDFGTTN